MGKFDPRLKANMLGKKTRDIYKFDRMNERDPNFTDEKQGASDIEGAYKGVVGSKAAMGASLQVAQKNMIVDYGQKFAEATVTMETAMMDAARIAIPAVTGALDTLAGAASKAAGLLGGKGERSTVGKFYDSVKSIF